MRAAADARTRIAFPRKTRKYKYTNASPGDDDDDDSVEDADAAMCDCTSVPVICFPNPQLMHRPNTVSVCKTSGSGFALPKFHGNRTVAAIMIYRRILRKAHVGIFYLLLQTRYCGYGYVCVCAPYCCVRTCLRVCVRLESNRKSMRSMLRIRKPSFCVCVCGCAHSDVSLEGCICCVPVAIAARKYYG